MDYQCRHKRLFLAIIVLLVSDYVCAENNDVYFRNDTLFCNLSYNEIGTLKSKASEMTDFKEIKTLVVGGYISQQDEDFIHTLGKNYNLRNLDMTELYSTMSYQGLEGCTKIKSVKYSRYWKNTGEYLFEDCTSLSEVSFPDDSECSLVEFSSGTFRGCISLETIIIPKSVKKLGSQVFYLCSNLKEIRCKSGLAPLANEDTFGGQFDTATIYVPSGAEVYYKTSAGWCKFQSIKEDANYDFIQNNDYSDNVYILNDTLFCDLKDNETGLLRNSVLKATQDLNSIKYAVIGGYLDGSDGSFLNALACSYSLSSLDFTNLHSEFISRQFQGCEKITEVKYSRYWTNTGWYLFEDCTNLKNVIFPENYVNGGYSSFEGGTFRGCVSLEEIEIPSTVRNVESQCFYLCEKLNKITLRAITPPVAKESSFGNQFLSAKLLVPKGTILDYKASAGWSLFKEIEENSEEVSVGEKELSDNIKFSDGVLYASLPVEEIGRLKATVMSKVDDLTKIKKVVLSNYISKEDANFLNALASAYSLNAVDFTELKNSFGDFAFQGCTKLEEVKYSRYWKASGWYLFEDCSSLAEVAFPDNYIDDGITTFETGSFRGCSSLESIAIPANVTSIGNQCFYLCSNLREVVFLGAAIKNIDKGAFEGCSSLETIIFPSSISLIGERCFESCSNIKELHCEATIPPEVSESAFDDIYDTATLFVPNGCLSKYTSAPVWKNFTSIKESASTGIDKLISEKENQRLTVFTIDGKFVCNGTIFEHLMQKLSKGCYIIRSEGKVKKVVVK